MDDLIGGFARTNITPPLGTDLGGYAAREYGAKSVNDYLFSSAAIFARSGKAVGLVSCDLLGLPNGLIHRIIGTAEEEIPELGNNILINATHTHSGPDIPTFYNDNTNQWMIEFLSRQIVGALKRAWEKRKAVSVGFGNGGVDNIGVNRRTEDGLPIDPSVGVVKAENKKTGELMGVLLNYTCHPVVLGPDNYDVTADYPGFAKRFIRSVYDKDEPVVLFSNGAEGDVNTGHSAEESAIGSPIPGRTFEKAQHYGILLGAEATKVIESIDVRQDLNIGFAKQSVNLEFRELPGESELEDELSKQKEIIGNLEGGEGDEDKLKQARLRKVYCEIEKRYLLEKQRSKDNRVDAEIRATSLGDTVFIGLPAEVFVEIGLDIKKNSPFRNTYVVGLANGYMGYVPTYDAIMEGGYEAVASKFLLDTGKQIRDASLEVAKRLKENIK